MPDRRSTTIPRPLGPGRFATPGLAPSRHTAAWSSSPERGDLIPPLRASSLGRARLLLPPGVTDLGRPFGDGEIPGARGRIGCEIPIDRVESVKSIGLRIIPPGAPFI